jgi:hypothetical protein
MRPSGGAWTRRGLGASFLRTDLIAEKGIHGRPQHQRQQQERRFQVQQRAIWLEHLAQARPLIKLDRLLSVPCRLSPIHQST